jgi:cation:H+ antiporter
MVVAGGALLALGGHWIVGAAERIARGMGVPEMVIGITLVAVGTSLPEMAATLVAAWQRESGIAVGNVVGSNLFNLLGVGGLVPLVRPVHAPGGGMGRELWSLAAITVLMALLVNRRQDIPRWGGVILLAAYGILLTWQMQLWP